MATSKSRSPRSPTKPPTAGTKKKPAAFVTQDPAAAYAHFLPLAQSQVTDSTHHVNIDADLVRTNVDTGVKAFTAIADAVQTAAPNAPIAQYLELPSLALALIYASDRVVEHASTGEIKTRIAALTALREPILEQLEIFSMPLVNLADPDRVKALRTGSGPLKRAHDAVNIAAYFAELGPAIAGKHPFTAAQLASLNTQGQWLVQQLTPSHAVTASAPNAAAVIRDQLWTLLHHRYDAMRGAAANVLGFQTAEARIPPLGTRAGHPHKAATAATTATNPTAPATKPAASTTPTTPAK